MPTGPLQVVPDIDDQLNEQKNKTPTPLLTPGTPLLATASPLAGGMYRSYFVTFSPQQCNNTVKKFPGSSY